MSSPEPDEVLFAYIAVASYAVSLVLIRVDNGVQQPVYYMSKSLHEAEVRYLPVSTPSLLHRRPQQCRQKEPRLAQD